MKNYDINQNEPVLTSVLTDDDGFCLLRALAIPLAFSRACWYQSAGKLPDTGDGPAAKYLLASHAFIFCC